MPHHDAISQPRHRQVLDSLRRAFPQPVSDPVHDAYFVYSIARALDQVDSLKSQAPILGAPAALDYAAARQARIADDVRPMESVIPELVGYLNGMFIWGHPRSQVNVVPQPSIASIIGVLLPATYNPNLCSEESAQRFSEAEMRVASMTASLIGFDARSAGGLFTFGGTGGLLYGVRVGLEKAVPGAARRGLDQEAVVLVSRHSHYSCLTVAAWLGIGQDNVIAVPTHADNSMQIRALEDTARQQIERGRKIAAIVATMGTTDAFGIDDIQAISTLRDKLAAEYSLDYRPHIHADAVIGWAWSVFNDYDFLKNELGFRGRTVRALAAAQHRIRHLHLADSVGVDFHKTGFCPYVSSLVLFKDERDFGLIARPRELMPYLYQSGEHHPGMVTLETTRAGGGPMAALASMLLLGKEGYRALLGHAVEMAEVLREQVEGHPNLTVLNGDNVGPVTLFRSYPDGVDTFTIKAREQSDAGYRDALAAHNDYNRRIFALVHAEALAGRGVAISLTDCYRQTDYGEPIVALKSYVVSPFADETRMQTVLDEVLKAREKLASK
jgi:glutamate/tyrosine decarboxylase-like PLP-dependent enzyme